MSAAMTLCGWQWPLCCERCFFFNPMVWLATRRASALAEHCADDAVLEATGQALPYAKMLGEIG